MQDAKCKIFQTQSSKFATSVLQPEEKEEIAKSYPADCKIKLSIRLDQYSFDACIPLIYKRVLNFQETLDEFINLFTFLFVHSLCKEFKKYLHVVCCILKSDNQYASSEYIQIMVLHEYKSGQAKCYFHVEYYNCCFISLPQNLIEHTRIVHAQ